VQEDHDESEDDCSADGGRGYRDSGGGAWDCGGHDEMWLLYMCVENLVLLLDGVNVG
jgi:hypothetical protein